MTTEAKQQNQPQREQQQLLAEALKRPGVAVALEVYGRVEQYAEPAPTAPLARGGYASGGNI
jgi:hypothetical protein